MEPAAGWCRPHQLPVAVLGTADYGLDGESALLSTQPTDYTLPFLTNPTTHVVKQDALEEHSKPLPSCTTPPFSLQGSKVSADSFPVTLQTSLVILSLYLVPFFQQATTFWHRSAPPYSFNCLLVRTLLNGSALSVEVSHRYKHASVNNQSDCGNHINRTVPWNPPPAGNHGKLFLFRQRDRQQPAPIPSTTPHETTHTSRAARTNCLFQLFTAACTRRIPPAAALKARPVCTEVTPCTVHPVEPEPRQTQLWQLGQEPPHCPPRKPHASPLQRSNRVPARTPAVPSSSLSQRSQVLHVGNGHRLTPTALNEFGRSGGADSEPGWDPSLWELWSPGGGSRVAPLRPPRAAAQ